MRMKLPWAWEPKLKPGAITALSIGGAAAEADPREQESQRGAEILERSKVETEELGDLAKLPPFRPVVIRLVRLFDRDDVKTEAIANLVEADSSMASELLAVVNSPLFAFQKDVVSPRHAITLLGVERTKSLAATLAMRSLMQGGPRTPVVRRFWVHSIATATIAKHLGAMFKVGPELSYLAALMHDLGRSGLLAAHPEPYAHLVLASYESTGEVLEAEKTAFGMTHCQAGALLAKAWNLPEPFREVTGHHHDATSDDPLVALVQLCCCLADDFMFQSVGRRDLQKPEDTVNLCAPGAMRAKLIEKLPAVNAAVVTAIQTLDF
jgi:HD-like signal output (HDOD) protein